MVAGGGARGDEGNVTGLGLEIEMNQGYAYRETIPLAAAGRTVLAHLIGRWRHAGEIEWRARIGRDEVEVDGRVAGVDMVLRFGQQLIWHRPAWEEPVVPLSFALLHLDLDLLAVAKPAGLPTLPSGGRFLEHTLLHRVQRKWPEATPVHRLDRGTSGVVLFARSGRARRELARAWKQGGVRRIYRGLVAGRVAADELDLTQPIGELPHATIGRVFAVTAQGRPARTRVRVLERRAATTLLAIEIETGRPHQIRIHLAHAGHPLVGEPFYGTGSGEPPASSGRALPGDAGYLLHAERLQFVHPATGRSVDIATIPPSKLRRTLGESPGEP